MNAHPGTEVNTVNAIVLAAGASTRMGRQKMLLEFQGQTLIQQVVAQISSSIPGQVRVVYSKHSKAILDLKWNTSPLFIENSFPEKGMLESIRVGLREVVQSAEAVLIALGDQPVQRPSMITRLLDAYKKNTDQIIIPSIGDKRGHPIFIPHRFFKEVLSSYDDQGLRGLLHAHPEAITMVETHDEEILRDLDTPADLERFNHMVSKQSDKTLTTS